MYFYLYCALLQLLFNFTETEFSSQCLNHTAHEETWTFVCLCGIGIELIHLILVPNSGELWTQFSEKIGHKRILVYPKINLKLTSFILK